MHIYTSYTTYLFDSTLKCITYMNTSYFSISLQIVSFCILFHICYNLSKQLLEQSDWNYENKYFIFFMIPIIAIMTENIAWMIKFLLPKTTITRTIGCLAWIFGCFKFHSLSLFLQKLTKKNHTVTQYDWYLFGIEAIISLCFIINTMYLIMGYEHCKFMQPLYKSTLFIWVISIINTVYTVIYKILYGSIPTVLKQQLRIVLSYLIVPYIICLMLEFIPLVIYEEQSILFANLGIIFIMLAFHFCYKKIMQFRFLNLSTHVKSTTGVALCISTDFAEIVSQLNRATSIQELLLIAQHFFTTQFHITTQQIKIYVRSNEQHYDDELYKNVECFLAQQHESFDSINMLLQHKLFIDHEIDFDAFYSDHPAIQLLSNFLKQNNIKLIVPIFNNKQLISYIIITKYHNQTIFNHEQQNKIIFFAQCMAPALYLQLQQNVNVLMQENKELEEELYAKHQEINQYKESIKKLLKDRIEHHIGIIFYKQKHFTFRNPEAQKLLGFNPNIDHNTVTTTALMNVAQQAERFRSIQSTCITTPQNVKLIATAMPYPEQTGGVIITIRQPEATDIIKMQLDALKDPSYRDYLLYLETTETGRLINELIPSSHESMLSIKLQLLHVALQKKSLFIQSCTDDALDISSLIKDINAKQVMQTLVCTEADSKTQQQSVLLFGINPLLYPHAEPALLDKAEQGIILIQNIEYLDQATQQKLAYFIRYSIFSPLHSEQRKWSDARIICSSEKSLSELLQEGLLIPALHKELQKLTLQMPVMSELPDEELHIFIDSYSIQTAQKATDMHALSLDDKKTLVTKNIKSMVELKRKIKTLMQFKVERQPVATTSQTKHTNISDCPDLQLAAELGKHALKDSRLMSVLWEKLGSQSKIAELLGVNRSSVNRRCKDFNLI